MEERLQEDRQENHRLPQLLTVTAATAGTLACSPGRACSLLEPFSPALPNMFVAGESCFHAQSCHEGLPCSVTNTCGWLFLCRMEWKGRFCQLLEIVSSAQGPSIFHRLRRIGTHQAVGRSDQGLGNPRPQPFNRQLRRSTNWQQHAGKVPGFARADWDSLHALASAPTARLMPFQRPQVLEAARAVTVAHEIAEGSARSGCHKPAEADARHSLTSLIGSRRCNAGRSDSDPAISDAAIGANFWKGCRKNDFA